jgi:hypothetical protein
VRAFGQEALEPRFRFRHGIGPRDAEGIETVGAGLLGQCRPDFNSAQKSRLA